MSTRKTYNNCADTASNPGTGTFTLLGAIPSSPTLLVAPRISTGVLADQDAPDYIAVDSADNTKWELGYGVYSASGTALTRTLLNSSTGSLINFTGTVNIYFSLNIGGLVVSVQMIGAANVTSQAQNLTRYLPVFGPSTTTEAQAVRFIVTRACTFQKLQLFVTTTPNSGQTYTLTVFKNGSAPVSGNVATMTNGNTSASDLVNTISLAAGDGIDVQFVTSATSGSTGAFSWSGELVF